MFKQIKEFFTGKPAVVETPVEAAPYKVEVAPVPEVAPVVEVAPVAPAPAAKKAPAKKAAAKKSPKK